MPITVISQISAAFGEFNKRCGAYSRKYGTKRYYYSLKRRPQISAAFWRKKLVSFSTFPYALCNLTFTNKLLVKGQNKKKTLAFHNSVLLKKFTAKANILCQFFFPLSWHFKREKPFFGKYLYCKTRTDYTYIKLRVQDFATGKNFSFNQ